MAQFECILVIPAIAVHAQGLIHNAGLWRAQLRQFHSENFSKFPDALSTLIFYSVNNNDIDTIFQQTNIFL